MIPGEYIIGEGEIELNKGRPTIRLTVSNTGDRPVQVGSHFHFFEVNKELVFDREKAFSMRLDIPAGTAVRFEPGQEKEVSLVALGGSKVVHGLNNLTNGSVEDASVRRRAFEAAREKALEVHKMGARIGRRQYADMFGPTTGDLVRLADTELFIEIERDFAVYGDEVKFGGGKVIRDGMGQSPAATRAEVPLTSSSPTWSSSTTGASSRRISASGMGGYAASARRETPTSWTVSLRGWSWEHRPRLSPEKG